MAETINVGDRTYRTVWLNATIKGSKKHDLLIVQLDLPDLVEPPTFYVDPSAVRGVAVPLPAGTVARGQVMALLVDQREDKLVVQIPGEAVSYGPRLVVPFALAA